MIPHKVPQDYDIVMTEDGSYTFFSHRFQESCHSVAGALKETDLHYIKGCKIEERVANHKPFTIFEVGFGLGVGFLATLNSLKKSNFSECTFISTEIDKNLLLWFIDQHPEFNFKWQENLLTCSFNLDKNFKFVNLIIILGDARIEVPLFFHQFFSIEKRVNAIYQDAFSPKKNPLLWTKEWFEFLKSISSTDCVLSTYSASTSIRKSLHEAGWGVWTGEKFGPKRSSTRAYLEKKTQEGILEQFKRSPIKALYDSAFSLNSQKYGQKE